MDIMTKVRVLWEKVAGITADVSAVDAKATATAATLAGILPRIPADYSENEVNTGVKWINGKYIYQKSFSGQTPTEAGTLNIGALTNFESVIHIYGSILGSGSYVHAIERALDISINTINYSIAAVISAGPYVNQAYMVTILYTKADPVPAQADNETRKRKTTKKEEK